MALSLALTTPSSVSFANDAASALVAAEQKRDLEIQQREIQAQLEENERKREELEADQKRMQEEARNNKQGGAMAANMLGIGLIAAGTIMVIIGSIPPTAGGNPALLPPGLFTLAGGMGAMMAGAAMGQNAGQNQNFANNLDSLNPDFPTVTPGFNVDDGTTTGDLNSAAIDPETGKVDPSRVASKLGIDPEALRNGALGEIMDKFEAETGLNREEFARGLLAGKSPAELLDGKANGLSKEQLEKGIAVAQGQIEAGGGIQGELEKLAKDAGLDELYGQVGDIGSAGNDYVASGGGLGGASQAGAQKTDLANLLGISKKGKKLDLGLGKAKELSLKDLNKFKAAAGGGARNLASRPDSLFSRVSRRYRKVSKLMLGFIPKGLEAVESQFEQLESEL